MFCYFSHKTSRDAITTLATEERSVRCADSLINSNENKHPIDFSKRKKIVVILNRFLSIELPASLVNIIERGQ